MRDDATARGAMQTPEHLGAIDALRGYAILMVIGVHTLPFVPALAWPAKRLLLLGVYGVQLFFLASAVTLMMSWSRSKQALPAGCRTFYLHRVLRIAPLYFLAIAFYWPPNHLIVCALGCLLYHLLHLPSLRALVATRRIGSNGASVALLLAWWALSLYGMRKQFDWAHGLPPTHVLITLCFMPWALVLILKGGRVVVNRAIVAFGKVSFSVYILHFAVLQLADAILRRSWPWPATGIGSLAYDGGLLVLTCALSFALAKLTYRYIEKPGIDLSRSLTRGRSVTLAA